jgi:hypothetical protein
MRYTLWSRGRLVGHTDLDVHTITSTMRQGFVEPTPEGKVALQDATGVWRAMAEVKRGARARGAKGENDIELLQNPVERRESLNLELRDATGNPFECAFIRITDLFDMNAGIVDEMCDTEEEEEAAFQIRLSSLSGAAREEALATRAALNAEIDEMVADIMEERDEQRMYDSDWPPPSAEDPRWDTMQYLLQAHLAGPDWELDTSPELD